MNLLLVLLLLIAAPLLPANESRPNIVFILADDMRPDCIRTLGHKLIETPHLDSLVRTGFVFSRAVAGYPICHVSRSEILSGTSAFRNGVQYRGKTIDPALKTLPVSLKEAGYRTWYSGKWHNDGTPTTRGYEATRGLYSSGGGKGNAMLPDNAGRKATGYTGWTFKTNEGHAEPDKGIGLTPDTDRFIGDAAVEVIQQQHSKPFFLHVNFTSPHDPRILPRGFEKKYAAAQVPLPPGFLPQHPFDHGNLSGRDELLLPKPLDEGELRSELSVYYACISNVDAQVGRIIEALRETKQFDHTIIVFSSDQGLALGSHGLLGKQNLYEHTFRVPLIFHGPGIKAGTRSDADCYLRDVFPTICELARIPIPETVRSPGLAALLGGGTKPVHEFVVGCFTDAQRAIRQGHWKLIHYPLIDKTQLFNLRDDPYELRDLSGQAEQAPILRLLREKLQLWLVAEGDPFVRPN